MRRVYRRPVAGWTGPPADDAVVLKYLPDRIARELANIIAAPEGAEDMRRSPMRRVPRRVVAATRARRAGRVIAVACSASPRTFPPTSTTDSTATR
jgi:hypothetical protein